MANERVGRNAFTVGERREMRQIVARHLVDVDLKMLENAFVIVYGDTNTFYVYDGSGYSDEDMVRHVEWLIREKTSSIAFKRKIIARSGNVFFVY